jgi:hypothetical protein
MHKIRLLLSALAGLVACAAGLTLLWFEVIVWGKARPNVMGIGGILALGGLGWALNRVMVAFGALKEEEPHPSGDPKAPPTDLKAGSPDQPSDIHS